MLTKQLVEYRNHANISVNLSGSEHLQAPPGSTGLKTIHIWRIQLRVLTPLVQRDFVLLRKAMEQLKNGPLKIGVSGRAAMTVGVGAWGERVDRWIQSRLEQKVDR